MERTAEQVSEDLIRAFAAEEGSCPPNIAEAIRQAVSRSGERPTTQEVEALIHGEEQPNGDSIAPQWATERFLQIHAALDAVF